MNRHFKPQPCAVMADGGSVCVFPELEARMEQTFLDSRCGDCQHSAEVHAYFGCQEDNCGCTTTNADVYRSTLRKLANTYGHMSPVDRADVIAVLHGDRLRRECIDARCSPEMVASISGGVLIDTDMYRDLIALRDAINNSSVVHTDAAYVDSVEWVDVRALANRAMR